MDQLRNQGYRVLKLNRELCRIGFEAWIPEAWKALLLNPMRQLSAMLAPLCEWPEGAELLTKPVEQGLPSRIEIDAASRPAEPSGDASPNRTDAGGAMMHPTTIPGERTAHGTLDVSNAYESQAFDMLGEGHTPAFWCTVVPSLLTTLRAMEALNLATAGGIASTTALGLSPDAALTKNQMLRQRGDAATQSSRFVARGLSSNLDSSDVVKYDPAQDIHRVGQRVLRVAKEATAHPDLTLGKSTDTSLKESDVDKGGRTRIMQPAQPSGLRLVQDPARLVAVLGSHIHQGETLAPSDLTVHQGVGIAPKQGNGEDKKNKIRVSQATQSSESSSVQGPERFATITEPTICHTQQVLETDQNSPVDIDELLDRLADRLELAFLRTYGTLGR